MSNLKMQAYADTIKKAHSAFNKIDAAQPDIERFEALIETLQERGLKFMTAINITEHCPIEYLIRCSSFSAGEIMLALASLGCDQRGGWIGGGTKYATIYSDRTPDFVLVVDPSLAAEKAAA